MVNEIGGVGLVSVAQSLGQASTGRIGADPLPHVEQRGRVDGRYDRFSGLAAAKDDAAITVKSIREAGKALEAADEILQRLDQQVQLVKNYPPFPPGNEQRQMFINSLSGLRRQFEALSIPPVDKGFEPVFYPKQSDFPELDPIVASDQDVADFSTAIGVAKASLRQDMATLHEMVGRLSAEVAADFPQPGLDAADAQILGHAVGYQVGGMTRPLMGNSTALNDLG